MKKGEIAQDIYIHPEAGQDGASYIVNNDVTEIYNVVELINKENVKIDIEPYFAKNGMLSQIFKGFEYRDEQLDMAKHIEKGLNNEKTVIVEAGTGTGKTLAYLIPAIEWSIKNKKRVVITTNTINLQEQLLNNSTIILITFLKLCNRKYYQVNQGELSVGEELSSSHQDQIKKILSWAQETETGDRSSYILKLIEQFGNYFKKKKKVLCYLLPIKH